jgi:hypothetical protein
MMQWRVYPMRESCVVTLFCRLNIERTFQIPTTCMSSMNYRTTDNEISINNNIKH